MIGTTGLKRKSIAVHVDDEVREVLEEINKKVRAGDLKSEAVAMTRILKNAKRLGILEKLIRNPDENV